MTQVEDIAPRSAEEINKDYSFHSQNVGHKTRVLGLLKAEIDAHLKIMEAIALEGSKLPRVTPVEVKTGE